MKRKLITLCISSLLVGTGIVFSMNQNVSVPTVEKFTEDTSAGVSKHESTVSKHENADKDEKTRAGDTMKKPESKEESSTKSSSGSDQKASTSNSSNTSDKSKKDVVSQPIEKPTESKQEPVVESTPTPELARPSYACPDGVNPNVSCNVILDTNFYYATYSSQAEAEMGGMYYLDKVMYIGDIEITNYSVQPVYRNDHSIAYYGLNLWSNGSLIQ